MQFVCLYKYNLLHLTNLLISLSAVPVAETTQQSLLNTVQQEITVRRQKTGITRQDSRLSVKSLIESIENAQKHAKINQDGVDSQCSSTSSINSLSLDNSHHHQHHRHTDPNLGDVVDNGDFCFEKNSQLITFSRSQSHHGTTDWLESSNNNNNNNHQVSDSDRSGGQSRNNDRDVSFQLHAPIVSGLTSKSPLRDQQQQLTNISNNQQLLGSGGGGKGVNQGEHPGRGGNPNPIRIIGMIKK